MIKTAVFAAVCMFSTAVAVSAKPNETFEKQIERYPKNMARHQIGTNLFAFDAEKMSYEPTEAAAAWLDDDVSTGFPPMAGRNYYLLALPEADLLTTFMISAEASAGDVSLYAGDEIVLPDSGSWSPVAKELDISEINGKTMRKPLNRFAKYLLIEANLTEAGHWYSVYTYGERPAVEFLLLKRDDEIDAAAVFGSYCNELTAISYSSLYTGARVVEADPAIDPVPWQKAIDDNPESSLSIAPSENAPGLALQYGSAVNIQRISLLTNAKVKGRFDFYLLETLESRRPVASNSEPQILRVANSITATTVAPSKIDLTGLRPTSTIILDGTSSRKSVDFTPTRAGYLLVQWIPADGTSRAELSELNSFSSLSLNDCEVRATAPSVPELADGEYLKNGKTFVDFKGGKGTLPPAVGDLFPTKIPFVPGALGAPVILNDSEVPTSP